MNFSKTWTYEDTRPARTRIACVKNAHAPPELDILDDIIFFSFYTIKFPHIEYKYIFAH